MKNEIDLKILCEKYHISEKTLKNQFKRTANLVEKRYKVRITKENHKYYEEMLAEEDNRALTLFEESSKKLMFDKDFFSTSSGMEFLVFLAIIATPLMVFRGSYSDFLSYCDIPQSKVQISHLKTALESLNEKNHIMYIEDKTDSNYFFAGLFRKAEKEFRVGIDKVKKCKEIQIKNGKKSFMPILKTWIGISIASEDQPFTMKDLCALTGLSEYQIRESKKLLEKDNVFITSKEYIDFQTCIGTNVDLNALYNEDGVRNKDFQIKN